MAKNRILLVDDSPNELRILMEVLKDKYAIVAATSGFQALQMIKDDQDIELVLLDVVMPDMRLARKYSKSLLIFPLCSFLETLTLKKYCEVSMLVAWII
jgi:DNA-binding NtrC family response regulator